MPIILVADDEEDQEELILQRFSGKPFLDGYEFVFARNGPDAWRKIQESPEVEMALLDINMPGMDGLTLLGKIKDTRPEMTSVIVSAYGDMTNIRSAMNKGAYDFLTKPIDLNDLEITLKKSLAQVRQVKEAAKTERENQSLKIKAVELEMQALRAQMNPHFIFNCLNSINNFILKNEQAKASEFLLKFSKLIRQILQNSMFPLITLDQELEALRLYIEIEALRFHQQFKYRIRLGDELDSMSVRVPPLIYQPFVENAIHHGLLPKEGPGHLELEIFEEGESLVCLVRDDGVGRPEPVALQTAPPAGHKSLGIRLTSERIGLLPIPDRSIRPVTIQDLTDAMGKPAGTEVRIQTPLQV